MPDREKKKKRNWLLVHGVEVQSVHGGLWWGLDL
jgi:hypothetical protein